MKVFCYFDEIPGIAPDRLLLDLWRKSWEHFGWETQMLSKADALARNPEACAKIMASEELRRGPCPEGYNLATHLRWAAHPGGLIIDYDVINNGFRPQDMIALWDDAADHLGDVWMPLFLNVVPCCCAVYADPEQVDVLLAAILEHADNPDASEGERTFVCHDQAIFERFADRWAGVPQSLVTEYTLPGWREAPLIHFCNSKTVSPRGRLIEALNLPQCQ